VRRQRRGQEGRTFITHCVAIIPLILCSWPRKEGSTNNMLMKEKPGLFALPGCLGPLLLLPASSAVGDIGL